MLIKELNEMSKSANLLTTQNEILPKAMLFV